MTEDSANQTPLGHDIFVSYASQDAADHAATAIGVVTRSHVPGRRKPMSTSNGVDTMNLDGLPGHIPDRRESVHGGCGQNLPVLHAPSYDWGARPIRGARGVLEPPRFTPRPMTSRDYTTEISTRFTSFPKSGGTIASPKSSG
jgi:hypothetical protein